MGTYFADNELKNNTYLQGRPVGTMTISSFQCELRTGPAVMDKFLPSGIRIFATALAAGAILRPSR